MIELVERQYRQGKRRKSSQMKATVYFFDGFAQNRGHLTEMVARTPCVILDCPMRAKPPPTGREHLFE
jgi:hypothetical protein